MQDCPHVDGLEGLEQLAANSLLDTTTWVCRECGTTDSVWACLTCFSMGCGRINGSHAEDHYRDTRHPLAMEINQRYVFCYQCNDWVLNDNADNDMEVLRSQLEQVREHKYSESRTRSGRVIRAAVLREPKDLAKEGKLYDILYRWRFLLVAKAFNTWLDFSEDQKLLRAQERAAEREAERDVSLADARQRKKPRPAIVPGHIGLRNLGNTCFMNAVIQALSHTSIIKHYFVGMEIPKPQSSDDETSSQPSVTSHEESESSSREKRAVRRRDTVWCFEHVQTKRMGGRSARKDTKEQPKEELSLSHEIHAILRVMWSGKWGLVTPHAMLHAVWRLIPSFRGYMQQDAQEFMCQLLDGLQDELTKLPAPDVWSMYNPHEPRPPHYASSSNIINATFGGTLMSNVRCHRCKALSTTTELFLDLSLDFPTTVGSDTKTTHHLSDMLEQFTRTEDLDGKVYMCENCNRDKNKPPILTNASKKLSLVHLPYVLRLHLKRFKWAGRIREKICAPVDFPIEGLDMRPYCEPLEEGKTLPEASTMYDLYAIINHHGTGFNTGHYTCYCRSAETGDWVQFNDARVSHGLSASDLVSPSAYILLYARRDLPVIHQQAQQGHLNTHAQSVKRRKVE
eukprot:comp20537_c0_seq1/m.26334 comp20537_c0_seq1/g.26334  ORF comp20537_c0_seq1/g.26334 comp20537_c0_seq1/m.26334 type:complete len:625 (-) comp20537_c0_seq1:127-2001(-)